MFYLIHKRSLLGIITYSYLFLKKNDSFGDSKILCVRPTCFPLENTYNDPVDCSGHGTCNEFGVCICDLGYEGFYCEIENFVIHPVKMELVWMMELVNVLLILKEINVK